ncbi:endolytic transglycosylase MltG [Ignavigranum ruoffiae]|uniref:endolytic transglycosylase MltG n=1 Tax=Ignavigranum ruoffiae TaxID=89093 RepID=UPI00206A1166|nr:endolytic transglycosylase MltG [Ignavigranum ruoffiae]UPQ85375.1 endolytic transglycosylase MltG [Ignavigranum ruoffiae]
MTRKNLKIIRQQAKENENNLVKERLWTDRIVRWVIVSLLVITLSLILFGYFYIHNSLQAVNKKQDNPIEVTIPMGSGSADVAKILADNKIIKNADIFTYYLKFNNDQELQAGHYKFTQAMDADQVIATLQAGGEPIFVDADTKLTVIEGMQLEEIAKMVGEQTAISQEEFLKKANDPAFIKQLQEKYPSFLEGLLDYEDLKYPLEGYIFPATYDYFAGMSVDDLITDMVGSANLVYQSYVEDLVNTNLTYHEVLTLASIIEKEANTVEDRGLVSGVFYNRLAAEMPLESDITVLYALGEHKEFVSLKDIEVDSPYNLYQHTGLGPGPFNTPSRTSIEAAIYPTWNDYYYFVADLDTGDIYYSVTLEEHQALVEEYVNSRQTTESTASESEEQSQE